MIAYGDFVLSASFGMVAISMASLGLHASLERRWEAERANDRLRQHLVAERLTADLRLSQVERSTETMLSEAQAAERLAVQRTGELLFDNMKLTKKMKLEKGRRQRMENRLKRAKARSKTMFERAHAAEALAEATEAHVLELDTQLTEALRLNLIYRDDNKTLREFSSRHLPEVAPISAQSDLEELRENLQMAKSDESPNRDYKIGLACSGLRTFEASAAGYSCRLGRALLAEARSLRQDPVCVAFENPNGISPSGSLASN